MYVSVCRYMRIAVNSAAAVIIVVTSIDRGYYQSLIRMADRYIASGRISACNALWLCLHRCSVDNASRTMSPHLRSSHVITMHTCRSVRTIYIHGSTFILRGAWSFRYRLPNYAPSLNSETCKCIQQDAHAQINISSTFLTDIRMNW